MQFLILTILLSIVPFNGSTRSFYWKIENNYLIISETDFDEIIAKQIKYDELTETNAAHFKDSIFNVNSMQNPYEPDSLSYNYLTDQDLFEHLIESNCIPGIINEEVDLETVIKKKVRLLDSPLGCSIYKLELIAKGSKRTLLSETVIIGLCD
jgi:hypothetical protein